MEIIFELSEKEAFSRQLESLWGAGFGADLLNRALPEIEALAKAHYLEIASSGTAGTLDPHIGIETGAMFADLTTPIIRNESIILETSLDYAIEQEERLAKSGRSFLPSDAEVFAVFQKLLSDLT